MVGSCAMKWCEFKIAVIEITLVKMIAVESEVNIVLTV